MSVLFVLYIITVLIAFKYVKRDLDRLGFDFDKILVFLVLMPIANIGVTIGAIMSYKEKRYE